MKSVKMILWKVSKWGTGKWKLKLKLENNKQTLTESETEKIETETETENQNRNITCVTTLFPVWNSRILFGRLCVQWVSKCHHFDKIIKDNIKHNLRGLADRIGRRYRAVQLTEVTAQIEKYIFFLVLPVFIYSQCTPLLKNTVSCTSLK